MADVKKTTGFGEEKSFRGKLASALWDYGQSDAYPFHMPGHKRNPAFMTLPPVNSIDITEIDGFDDLHHSDGILKEVQERAARVRGAERTWFVVNGSTCGILAAVSACVRPGERILLARNCHKAVYNAIELRGLNPVYLYPKLHEKYGIYEGVEAREVQRLLEIYPDIKAVVITSPTYEGIISDVEAVVRVAHEAGIPLIVDSAHGAHLGYSPDFFPSPVSLGADLVIESLHKTLPSMTQTALLHRCMGLVDERKVEKYLSMYESSSPSYVMMAAMDQCVSLLKDQAGPLFSQFFGRLEKFYQDCRGLKNMRLLMPGDFQYAKGYDLSKLVFYVTCRAGMGPWLYDRLREDYHLQMEMASADYVLAMTSICDTDEGFRRLKEAVFALDERLEDYDGVQTQGKDCSLATGKGTLLEENLNRPAIPVMNSAQAAERECVWVDLKDAPGHISQTYVYIYPPGIPMIVPGEQVPKAMPSQVVRFQKAGLKVHGLETGETGKEEPRMAVIAPEKEIGPGGNIDE
ncbi:arginine/lysine/ornithine decarboxylase [Catenibacillus scindens]|uniref:Arginine/lysine/ornithine decarboxylase n=1 Tax=Catenibacillus scindens TaxID=673271 RepID=A0A7W8HA99_9FIRM|nr:aminotransferase class I/II-fold pyridoxal phosphate-dependent enzyme [Catenibacillus scindens]MBB5264005.1 arginine/lysine/ornithine decarboxylase [Catenibacillus scindens]